MGDSSCVGTFVIVLPRKFAHMRRCAAGGMQYGRVFSLVTRRYARSYEAERQLFYSNGRRFGFLAGPLGRMYPIVDFQLSLLGQWPRSAPNPDVGSCELRRGGVELYADSEARNRRSLNPEAKKEFTVRAISVSGISWPKFWVVLEERCSMGRITVP